MLASQIYLGIVEDRNDPLKLGRCRVRIAGCHTHDLSMLPTKDLPWATVVQPITGGMGQAVLAPVEGTMVQVQFFDYPDNQMPIVTGIIPTIPQEKSVFADEFEDGPILKDELTPQGRKIPTNSTEATGGVSSSTTDSNNDAPSLNGVQQQGVYSQSNRPGALMASMVSASPATIGATGSLAQSETSLGQSEKSRADEFESKVMSLGKAEAIKSYANELAKSLGTTLPTDLINGNETMQSVLSKLNSYFAQNGLSNVSEETMKRLKVLNITDPKVFVTSISTGLNDLKDSIRSNVEETLHLSEISSIKNKVESIANDFSIGSITSILTGGGSALSSAQEIASMIGGGYTAGSASDKNVGNIGAIEEKGSDKVSSADFEDVGEGMTPPTQGSFGGANYGGADAEQEKPSAQDTEKYPSGASRDLDLKAAGLTSNQVNSLLSACRKHGLNTLEAKASLLAILKVMNGVSPKHEESTFSAKELMRRFPLSFSGKEDLALKYSLGKKDEREFFNFVYDSSNDGRTYGNTYPSDGYKFHGYGYIPIIGRSAYSRYADLLGNEPLRESGYAALTGSEPLCAEIAVLEFLSRTNGIPPTAHPHFFYAACRVFGISSNEAEPTYCKLYGAMTQNQFGIGEYAAGNAPDSNQYYGNKEGQPDTGFIDPSHRYPRDRFTDQATTARLAKGDIGNTIVTKKEQMRRLGVPIAMNRGTWDQPHSAYGAKYPYDNVSETESGHVVEYDDTPQHERIHVYHRTGTFDEIDQNGTKVTRIVGDRYTIIDRNGYISIDGDANVTVSGTASIYVRNDANIQVEGSTELKCGGSLNVGVAKDFNLAAQGSINMFANGTIRFQGKKDGHILTGEDLYVSSGGKSNYKSDGSMLVTSMEDMDALVSGNHHLTVKGTDDVKVNGNRSVEVDGDSNTNVRGSETYETAGSLDRLVDGSSRIQSKGSIDMKAGSNLKLTGSSVHAKGSSSVNLGASIVNVKSSAATNIQSGASMNLKSGGVLGMSGKPINLNSGGVGGASDPEEAGDATEAHDSEEAKEATKALIYGMVPPPIGTPTRISLQPLVVGRPIGEDEFMIETPEEGSAPIAKQSIKTQQAEEGVTNTDEGQTAKPSSSVTATVESKDKDAILNCSDFRADTKLSEHFTLGMFFDGGFNRKHILCNQAGLTKQEIVLNLSRLANNVMEKIIDVLPGGWAGRNKQWRITSGYRMTKSSTSRSDHPKGRAVDFQLTTRSKTDTWKLVQRLEKLVNYDQMLLEYRGAYSVWIHVSYRGASNRKQAMTLVNDKVYKQGFTLLA